MKHSFFSTVAFTIAAIAITVAICSFTAAKEQPAAGTVDRQISAGYITGQYACNKTNETKEDGDKPLSIKEFSLFWQTNPVITLPAGFTPSIAGFTKAISDVAETEQMKQILWFINNPEAARKAIKTIGDETFVYHPKSQFVSSWEEEIGSSALCFWKRSNGHTLVVFYTLLTEENMQTPIVEEETFCQLFFFDYDPNTHRLTLDTELIDFFPQKKAGKPGSLTYFYIFSPGEKDITALKADEEDIRIVYKWNGMNFDKPVIEKVDEEYEIYEE